MGESGSGPNLTEFSDPSGASPPLRASPARGAREGELTRGSKYPAGLAAVVVVAIAGLRWRDQEGDADSVPDFDHGLRRARTVTVGGGQVCTYAADGIIEGCTQAGATTGGATGSQPTSDSPGPCRWDTTPP